MVAFKGAIVFVCDGHSDDIADGKLSLWLRRRVRPGFGIYQVGNYLPTLVDHPHQESNHQGLLVPHL